MNISPRTWAVSCQSPFIVCSWPRIFKTIASFLRTNAWMTFPNMTFELTTKLPSNTCRFWLEYIKAWKASACSSNQHILARPQLLYRGPLNRPGICLTLYPWPTGCSWHQTSYISSVQRSLPGRKGYGNLTITCLRKLMNLLCYNFISHKK